MRLIEVEISESGEHWYKRIKVLGVTVYYRHDYVKGDKPRPVGFVTFPDAIVEVEDEFD